MGAAKKKGKKDEKKGRRGKRERGTMGSGGKGAEMKREGKEESKSKKTSSFLSSSALFSVFLSPTQAVMTAVKNHVSSPPPFSPLEPRI